MLNSRNDLFRIDLPLAFIPKEIQSKYEDYIKRLPFNITSAVDLVNFSIQSLTIPSFSYEPVEQWSSGLENQKTFKKGSSRLFRPAINVNSLIDRKLTLTLQLLDGNINYWILLDTFFQHYSFVEENPFTQDIIHKIFDAEGNQMISIVYKDCLFTGISEFTSSYSETMPDFKTFTIDFSFNTIETKSIEELQTFIK